MAEDQPDPNRSPDDEPSAAEPSDDGVRGSDADATRFIDPDATQVAPVEDADATKAVPPPDDAATHVIRPQTPDPTAVFPQVPDVWRGTATPRPPAPESDPTSMWDPAQRPPGRGWWLPILLSVIGVALLVGLAFALVVAMRGNSNPTPTVPPPVPPSTGAASVAPVTPSLAPSTPPTPSDSSSPSPAPDASFVTVPANLVGLLTPDVEGELEAVGLHYILTPQVDGTVIENTVLSLSPTSGSAVAPGSTVTIVYSVLPPPPPPSDSASPAAE